MPEVDEEYRKLESLLAQEMWKEADDATRSILRALTGCEANLEPEAIPLLRCEDLRRIDALWQQHSNGLYGFRSRPESGRRLEAWLVCCHSTK